MKKLATVLIAIMLIFGALVVFEPKEEFRTDIAFDETLLTDGVETYLAGTESRFSDITPGVEKRVIWAAEPEARTELSLVYVHGFSATLEETRPLADLVAEELGANLYYTRLTGHGRGSAAMIEATAEKWMSDIAEALAIGSRIGERVIMIGTSTGGTLATLAVHEEMGRNLAGVVLVSPNFQVKNPAVALFNWPYAKWWLPLFAGQERSFVPFNEAHELYWTTSYPTMAVFPMTASVKAALAAPHAAAETPALFVFDAEDQVVDHEVTRAIAAAWGGPATIHEVRASPDSDPVSHVIAGDILSPAMTRPMADFVSDWIRELP